jgi:hypothetical protein
LSFSNLSIIIRLMNLLRLISLSFAITFGPGFLYSQNSLSITSNNDTTLYAYNYNPLNYNSKSIKSVNSKSNRLYTGIDNVIYFISNGISYDSLFFTCSNGPVYEDEGIYYCHPVRSGRARIGVYGLSTSLNKTDTVQIAYCDFVVQSLPAPSIKIDGTIIKDLLPVQKNFFVNNDSLSIFYSDDIIGSNEWLEVESFTIGYAVSGYFKSFYNDGRILTEANKQIVYRLRPGTELSIKVKVSNPDDITINLPVVKLQIF